MKESKRTHWFSSTNGSRETMCPLWFFHLYILSSATIALSTLCQGRLYPPFICVYVYIYIYFFICPHVHSLENTLRTSSSLTPAGKFPINTWWLSGALRAVSLASLVFIPPRASLDERAGAGWGLGGGCKTGWERGWKKKKKKKKKGIIN